VVHTSPLITALMLGNLKSRAIDVIVGIIVLFVVVWILIMYKVIPV